MNIRKHPPVNTEELWAAVSKAKDRKDNPPAYGNILSEATSEWLDNMEGSLKIARSGIFSKQALSTQATEDKDIAMAVQHMLNSHYIQVLNMQIEEKIFPASYRAFYGIPVSSAVVPDQNTVTAVAMLSQKIIDGEVLMIAAGGHAIPFPLVTTIHTNLTTLLSKNKKHLDATDAINLARENIKVLNIEAALLSKKVWDEVETYYDGGTIESRRKNSRMWGVIYLSSGVPILISGHIMEIIAGAPVPIVGVNILVVETEETSISGAEGVIAQKVLATGTVTIRFSFPDFKDKDIILEIEKSDNIDLGVVTMVRN